LVKVYPFIGLPVNAVPCKGPWGEERLIAGFWWIVYSWCHGIKPSHSGRCGPAASHKEIYRV
jgi:hypothetical protein